MSSCKAEHLQVLCEALFKNSVCCDRVNAAFLDKLEHQGRGKDREPEIESAQDAEGPSLTVEDLRRQATTGQVSLSCLKPDPEQCCSDWTQEAGKLRLDV